jgi:hypothetical protein
MTPETYIEKAIQGGFKVENEKHCVYDFDLHYWNEVIEKIILDPQSWQAVGKVEGWDSKSKEYKNCINQECKVAKGCFKEKYNTNFCYECGQKLVEVREVIYGYEKDYMHHMIDALVEGKTIEEFLKNL